MLSRGPELRDLVLKNHEEGKGTCSAKNLKSIFVLKIQNFSGDLCPDDVRGIESWTFDLSVEDENLLTDSGKLEHTQFGQRMKKRLPTLLGGSYNSEQITVRTKILSFFREIIENVKVLLLSYK